MAAVVDPFGSFQMIYFTPCNDCLVGGFNPSETYYPVPIYGKKNVPNHQSVAIGDGFKSQLWMVYPTRIPRHHIIAPDTT